MVNTNVFQNSVKGHGQGHKRQAHCVITMRHILVV